MKITKIHHSCVLIEDKDTKILIDPGIWAFEDQKAKGSDFFDVDAVLVTHDHQDHYYPHALKEIAEHGARIITNKELAEKMKEAGISAEALGAEQTLDVKGISVKGVHCAHGSLLVPTPENIGFLIAEKLFHPGDCVSARGLRNIEVLFAPIIAPWMKMTDGSLFVKALKPKVVVPIHEAVLRDSFAQTVRDLFDTVMTKEGFSVKAKNPGESFEI